MGDFLKAERSFVAVEQDPVDSASFDATVMAPTQAHEVTVQGKKSLVSGMIERSHGPEIHPADMPHKAVGEIVIIGTTPTTATGMIPRLTRRAFSARPPPFCRLIR